MKKFSKIVMKELPSNSYVANQGSNQPRLDQENPSLQNNVSKEIMKHIDHFIIL
jgi:hypothetical protein